tara:strand:+ start:762 stop:1142 length:381 start_codon:yes stop_codon:yes gene_type:complete
MASILRVNTLTDASSNNSTAMSTINQGTAKAWQNLNGESTISTRDSFNIASTTDTATGIYQPSFSNAMNNNFYSITTNGHRAEDHAISARDNEQTTSLYVLMSHNHTNTSDVDSDSIFSTVHGDLA